MNLQSCGSSSILERLPVLYENDPRARAYIGGLSEVKKNIANLQTLPDFSSLQALSDFDDPDDSLVDLLSNLNPTTLAKEFGENATLWAWHRDRLRCASISQGTTYLIPALVEEFGYNRSVLQKAWIGRGRDTVALKKYHDLYMNLNDSAHNCFSSDTWSIFATTTKYPDVTRFAIEELVTEDDQFLGRAAYWNSNSSHGVGVDIYMDAPMGITLTFDDVPQAMAAFTIIDHETLDIRQLQGVTHVALSDGILTKNRLHSRGIQSFAWREYLIYCCARIAEQNGLNRLQLLGGANSRWSAIRENPLNAAKSYDIPARNMGFLLDEDGNWSAKTKDIVGSYETVPSIDPSPLIVRLEQ